ncbi:MAG: peptide deformylase [bacterium JZ-2024 1]
MIRDIRTFDDPVLRQRARKVTRITDEIRELVRDMQETMEAHAGVGLAATQVGVLLRVFVWKVSDEEHGALINPSLVPMGGKSVDTEGCLSLPGIIASVARSERVIARGMDLSGRKIEIPATGLLARVFQHEFDHLEGILITDRAIPGTIRLLQEQPAIEVATAAGGK